MASGIRAGMSFLILVTQFMPSPVLSPRKNLFRLEKQGIESRGWSPRTLVHPGYSHACTRFPFLALLTRFSALVEDGKRVLLRRFPSLVFSP